MDNEGAHPEPNFNILIAVTGSVATIKLFELIEATRFSFEARQKHAKVTIQVIMTKNSQHFMPKNELINRGIEVYEDADEWETWKRIGDDVLHIELRRWADLLLIAPLDANTMAKMTHGICDNLLTCVVRAWDSSKPLVYCPAMNTLMYQHPITKEHLEKLQNLGYIQIDCIEKTLACGDVGLGAMAHVTDIANKVVDLYELSMTK